MSIFRRRKKGAQNGANGNGNGNGSANGNGTRGSAGPGGLVGTGVLYGPPGGLDGSLNGGPNGGPNGSSAKKPGRKKTVGERRSWRRRLAAAVFVLWILALPLTAINGLIAYRFFFAPAAEDAREEALSYALGEHGARAIDDFDRVETARAKAVEFSGEYLSVDPEEDQEEAERRIGGLLSKDLDVENVVPAPPSGSRSYVMSSHPVFVRPVDGDTFEVRTRNRVMVEPIGEQAATEAFEAEEETVPRPEVKMLAVWVGVDEGGGAAVVDPPTLLGGGPGYSGDQGVLDFSEANPEELNEDEGLATLLRGYFAALYGREESRATLSRFLAPGAKIPQTPPEDLVFVEIADSVLRPRTDPETEAMVPQEAGGVAFSTVYDVEVWATARSEDGMVVNQTHLLTAGYTEDGQWLILGER